MTWTDERIDELTRLWDAGYSASHIGKLLGISKNAVIGKAHRLKLSARPSPIRAERLVPRAPRPAPTLAPKPRPMLQVVARPAPRPVRRRLGGPSCLWPIGDPSEADFHFCSEPAVPGKPYCDNHCTRAYISRPRAGIEAA